MAAPNIANADTITGKTAVLALGNTSANNLLANSGSSGKVFKVNLLMVSNIHASADAEITVDVYRSTTGYNICKSLTVPNAGTVDLLNRFLYLEEGDTLRCTASSADHLEVICSYEEIS